MMLKERLIMSTAVRGLFDAASFEIHGDNDVGAEQQRAFDGNRGGQKAVHESAALVLNGHEKSGIGAGRAQRRGDRRRSI